MKAALILLMLSTAWPRHAPPPPPPPCRYWIGIGPMPLAPPGYFWACFEPDLLFRLYAH